LVAAESLDAAFGGLGAALGGPLGGVIGAATPPIVSTDSSITYDGARAMGGPVSPNNAYLVGERGPEVFVPGRGGSILPNGAGGGSNHYYSIDARGTDPVQTEMRVRQAIQAAHQSAIVTSIQAGAERMQRVPQR
jgi:hypothetical protein